MHTEIVASICIYLWQLYAQSWNGELIRSARRKCKNVDNRITHRNQKKNTKLSRAQKKREQ